MIEDILQRDSKDTTRIIDHQVGTLRLRHILVVIPLRDVTALRYPWISAVLVLRRPVSRTVFRLRMIVKSLLTFKASWNQRAPALLDPTTKMRRRNVWDPMMRRRMK